MNLEINIISREIVTPSSPTPQHLKEYKLSFIDQTIPHFLIPHVLFYPANNDFITTSSKRSDHLKKSLSQALAQFYPLAGRLVGNSYVNCNDDGVTFIEAQANVKLCDVITDPDAEELNKFILFDPFQITDVCMIVQATFFACGGLAIGLRISHKIADALSYFLFVNTWAAASRGDILNNIQSPIFEGAAFLPPRKDLALVSLVKKENKIIKKRFVFTAQKINDLKDKYTSNDIRPTRVEALSTFIWTRFMVATGAKDDTNKAFVLRFPVDIRTRMVPSLSEYHFGNIFLPVFTDVLSLDSDKDDAAGYGIVKKIRDAIHHIDQDYIAKTITEGNKPLNIEGKEVVMFRFSSLCRIPLHKADFGWGIPVLVGSGKTPISNVVHFMALLSGDGIEAWVNLEEEDMIKFEGDKELLEYVSLSE